MKILILGSTGMLGNAVGSHFLEHFGEDNVFLSYRNERVAYGKNKFYFNVLEDDLSKLPKVDYVINCVGIIKPFMKESMINAIKINSLLPRELANYCKKSDRRLIHITTDCVFSGREGNYSEESLHDCLDDYGKVKSLGEPDNCMVLRTSIIGEEIHKNASLIAWAKSQKDKTVNGFVNHDWNGITTKQYGIVCQKIIDNDLFENSLFHLFSNAINKYQLLSLINERFDLNLTINPVEAPDKIDRTLTTVKSLNAKLDIPTLADQIQAL